DRASVPRRHRLHLRALAPLRHPPALVVARGVRRRASLGRAPRPRRRRPRRRLAVGSRDLAMSIQLGPVSLARVVEIPRSTYPTAQMLPDSTPDAIARHHAWLKPHFWDESTGDLGSRIQTYVVRTPRHTVLIDTGVGNDKSRAHNALWNLRQGAYLDDLA